MSTTQINGVQIKSADVTSTQLADGSIIPSKISTSTSDTFVFPTQITVGDGGIGVLVIARTGLGSATIVDNTDTGIGWGNGSNGHSVGELFLTSEGSGAGLVIGFGYNAMSGPTSFDTVILNADGDLSNPAYSFSNEPSLGIRRYPDAFTHAMGFVSGGADALVVHPQGILLADGAGTSGMPFAFLSDNQTGLFTGGPGVLGIGIGPGFPAAFIAEFNATGLQMQLGTMISFPDVSVQEITTDNVTPQMSFISNSAFFNFVDVDFGDSNFDAFNFTADGDPESGIGIVFAEDVATFIGRHNNSFGLFGAPNIFLNGNLTPSSATVTADISLIATDTRENNVILIDATSNNVTVDLTQTPLSRWDFTFKRIDASSNTVTISATTDKIDGANTYVLSTQWESVRLVSNATTWNTVATNTQPGGVSFPLFAPDGTESTPSYSFSSDHGAGLSFAGHTIALSLSGTAQVYFNIAPNNSTIEVIHGAIQIDEFGSSSAPSLAFGSAAGNTGFYNVDQFTVGFTSGGTDTIHFTADGIMLPNGNITTPSIFWSDPGSGFYYDGTQGAIVATNILDIPTGNELFFGDTDGTDFSIFHDSGSDSLRIKYFNGTIRVPAITIANTTGDLSVNTRQIHDVVDPTSDQDAATKKYVDDNSGGGGGGLTGSVDTTDGTQTTVLTIPTVSDKSYYFEIVIVGIRTGGGAGSTDDTTIAVLKDKYKNVGGTVSLFGTDSKEIDKDNTNTDVNAVISGTNVLIQVTGDNDNAYHWTATAIFPGGGGGGGVTFPLLAPDGLDSAPSYSFTSHTDAGMTINVSGNLCLDYNGNEIIGLNATEVSFSDAGGFQVLYGNGTAGAPAIGFNSFTSSGLWISSDGNNLNLDQETGNFLNLIVAGDTILYAAPGGVAIAQGNLIMYDSGDATNPAIIWSNDQTTGFSNPVTGQNTIVCTNVDVADFTPDAISLNTALNVAVASISHSDTPYNLTNKYVVLSNASAGGIIVNLLDATICDGRTHVIKKTDSSANTVTVQASGSQTIDGSNTYVLTTQYESITIVTDGANWFII